MKRSLQLSLPVAIAASVGILVVVYLAFSYEKPTPRSAFDHSEFLLPLQGLAYSKAFQMTFSVGYESYRYRILLGFAEPDSSSGDEVPEYVIECLRSGVFRIHHDATRIAESRRDRSGGVRGWSVMGPGTPVIYLDSRLHLEPGRQYRLDLEVPEFTPRCQQLEPQLELVVMPRPDL